MKASWIIKIIKQIKQPFKQAPSKSCEKAKSELHFKLQNILKHKSHNVLMSTPSFQRESEHIKRQWNVLFSLFFFLRQLKRRHVDGVGLYNKKKETKTFFFFFISQLYFAAHWNFPDTWKGQKKKSWNQTQNNFSTSSSRMILRYMLLSFFVSVNPTVNATTASIRWENCFSVETTGCCWFRWIA